MEKEDIIEQMLKGLLQKTVEKKIPWKMVNSNALRWVKTENAQTINVTLQQQPLPAITNVNYILTVQGPNPSNSTQINSSTQPNYKETLRSIFTEAMKIGNSESLEIIRKLLDGV
jgi:hypothetical protein